MIEEKLSTENRNSAYLCGRLIAVIEKLQESTLENKADTTIVTTYYPAFERQPLATLPRLRHLSQVYMRKLKRNNSVGLAVSFDKKISSIMELFEGEIPNTLTREERGIMAMGYYQQKADLYKKKASV